MGGGDPNYSSISYCFKDFSNLASLVPITSRDMAWTAHEAR